jgi:hypothetical protein
MHSSRGNRCSFCNSQNHNILSCNDPRTYEIERVLRRNGVELLLTGNKERFIRYFINEIPLKYVRLFACRLNIRSSDNRMTIIENIYIKLQNSVEYRAEISHRARLVAFNIQQRQILDRQVTELILLADSFAQRPEISVPNGIQTPPRTPPAAAQRVQPPNIHRERNNHIIPRTTFAPFHLIPRYTFPVEPQFKPTQSILPNQVEYDIENPVECPICYTDIKCSEYVKTTCNHEYCVECINGIYKTAINSHSDYMPCAICRRAVTKVETYSEIPSLFQL